MLSFISRVVRGAHTYIHTKMIVVHQILALVLSPQYYTRGEYISCIPGRFGIGSLFAPAHMQRLAGLLNSTLGIFDPRRRIR